MYGDTEPARDSLPRERILFDPSQPGFAKNPYPFYADLRTRDPVHRSQNGAWILSRYADIVDLLRDRSASSQALVDAELRKASYSIRKAWQESVMASTLASTMLFKDPPDHTRLRNLVSKAFTPRAVSQLKARVRSIAQELLETASRSGKLDLIEAFASPLPAYVIGDLLGVPVQDRELMRHWAGTELVKPFLSIDRLARADRIMQELLDYFSELIEERRKQPRDDLLSSLISAHEGQDFLTTRELLVTVALIFVAAHETVENLLGTALLTLLRHPSELARLRREPTLIDAAVEECLRYESPVQVSTRVLTSETKVRDATFEAGARVAILIGAANRDPDQFVDPDRFDVGRSPNKQLAFGTGIHFCLGAALARLEARVALGTLLEQFTHIEMAGEPRFRPTFTVRGLESLPIEIHR